METCFKVGRTYSLFKVCFITIFQRVCVGNQMWHYLPSLPLAPSLDGGKGGKSVASTEISRDRTGNSPRVLICGLWALVSGFWVNKPTHQSLARFVEGN